MPEFKLVSKVRGSTVFCNLCVRDPRLSGFPWSWVRDQTRDHFQKNPLLVSTQDTGHYMRHRYGKGTKTHKKFDEEEMSLFTSVRLPGEEEWARITPSFARRTMRSRDETVSESWETRYGNRERVDNRADGDPPAAAARRRSESDSVQQTEVMEGARRPWAPRRSQVTQD